MGALVTFGRILPSLVGFPTDGDSIFALKGAVHELDQLQRAPEMLRLILIYQLDRALPGGILPKQNIDHEGVFAFVLDDLIISHGHVTVNRVRVF